LNQEVTTEPLTELTPRRSQRPGDGPLETDVLVVGGGPGGAATAYHLASRGLRVLGLDRYPAAHDVGASHQLNGVHGFHGRQDLCPAHANANHADFQRPSSSQRHPIRPPLAVHPEWRAQGPTRQRRAQTASIVSIDREGVGGVPFRIQRVSSRTDAMSSAAAASCTMR